MNLIGVRSKTQAAIATQRICASRFGVVSWLLVVMALTVSVRAAETFYVDPAGSHTSPYDTWGKASTNIQVALDAAAGGDTVLVGAGEYAIYEQINVVTGLNLIADQGPDATIITRAGGSIRILYSSHADAFISGFTLTNGNVSHGSGIYMVGGTVSNCVITGNSHNRGSAIRMVGGLLTHSVIRDNQDTGNYQGCGGARISNGAVIEWCTFINNQSGSENVGVSAVWSSGADTVRNSVFIGNRRRGVVQRMTTVRLSGANAVFENNLVYDNEGHGIFMNAAAFVQYCTITGNRALSNNDQGHGVWMSAGTLRNSIVYGNGAAWYAAHANDIHHGGGTISATCAGVAPDGGGNIAADPMYRDPAAADYRLSPGSPCLDSADVIAGIDIDLEGESRPMDGSGDGISAPDMGAYEAQAADAGDLRCGITASVQEHVGPAEVTLMPRVAGAATNITFAGWDFGDGTISNRTDLAPVSHIFGLGRHTVSLTVSNDLATADMVIYTNFIRIAPEQAFVAPGGTHTPPFADWATAATDIQSAIYALLSTNGEVRSVTVDDGTYGLTYQTEVFTPVRVASVNGPEVTEVMRASGTARIFNIAHPDAFVSGFTFRGGNLGHGSGLLMSGGMVSNCVIVGNTHNRASAIRMTGGVMTHCDMRSNLETGNSGGCGGARISGDAVIEWSTFYDNRPGSENYGVMALWISDQAIVRNSVIYEQRANGTRIHRTVLINGPDATLQNSLIVDNPGHGVYMTANATIENCTITRNVVYGDVGNGIWMSAGTVRNSIVWNNGGDNLQNVNRSGGTFRRRSGARARGVSQRICGLLCDEIPDHPGTVCDVLESVDCHAMVGAQYRRQFWR